MIVYPYLKGLRRYMLIGFLSGMTSSYLLSYVPVFHSKIMETLIKKETDDIYKYMYLYYSYSFLGNILAGIRGYIFTTYIQLFSSRIKKDILLSFFKKDLMSFSEKKPSEIADILLNDSSNVSDLYCLNANVAMRDIAQFVTTAYILLPISCELFFVNFCLASLQLVIEQNYHKYIYEKSIEKCTNILLSQKELIHDYTNKTDTYKSLGMEEDVYKKWNKSDIEYTKIKRKEALYYGYKIFINQSINQLMIMMLILFGMWRKIAYDDIIIFILYNPSLCSMLMDMMHIRADITRKKKSMSNINEIFDASEQDKWSGVYIPVDNDSVPTIRLENMSFSYSKNVPSLPILKNINLNFNSGTIVGIQGKSGVGKSTILKILLGLYKPTAGSVLFDNVKLNDIDKDYFYSKLVSFVGQEPVLFTGTTLENIVSNMESYDKELLESFTHLIDNIPDHTKMSGGQRQRIAICRAFMRKPKILLLDEPTSALDVENEKMILDMIKEMHHRLSMTVIIVSHKSTTLDICDTIVEL
jgi:ABC-type bacteriocin/lantibiotic exporter with double-glycine peptidase domain